MKARNAITYSTCGRRFRRVPPIPMSDHPEKNAVSDHRRSVRRIGSCSEGRSAPARLNPARHPAPHFKWVRCRGRIREHSSNSEILFVSQHSDPEMVQAALRLGAHGYLLKSDAAELPVAIKTI